MTLLLNWHFVLAAVVVMALLGAATAWGVRQIKARARIRRRLAQVREG